MKKHPKTLSNFTKSSRAMLPSLGELEQVRGRIKQIPNRRGEFLGKIHYGCYLLCSESGLRISEAMRFDLKTKTQQGLYRISKPKGKKERLVYISPQVIRELKANKWQPSQTNRWNFYHFLKKIKRELNINKEVELTPHTFRRAFTTYHANSGMPLPLLQKLLGHSSIRTTALYWRNIYGKDDTSDILTGKKWLENRKKEPPLPENSASPIRENFPTQSPRNFEPINKKDKSVISIEKSRNQDNSLLIAETKKTLTITNYQPKSVISEISPKPPEKFSPNFLTEIKSPIKNNEHLPLITNQREQPNAKEQILLTRVKQLEEQLKAVQAENKHLKSLIQQEQKTEAKVIQPLPFKGNK